MFYQGQTINFRVALFGADNTTPLPDTDSYDITVRIKSKHMPENVVIGKDNITILPGSVLLFKVSAEESMKLEGSTYASIELEKGDTSIGETSVFDVHKMITR